MLVHSGDRGTARRISGAQPYEALRRAESGPRETKYSRTHPAEITANRLAKQVVVYAERLTPDEVRAAAKIHAAFLRIAKDAKAVQE